MPLKNEHIHKFSLPQLRCLLNVGLQQKISSSLHMALYGWYKKFFTFLLKQLRYLHRTYFSCWQMPEDN